jgi:hypothetical protein
MEQTWIAGVLTRRETIKRGAMAAAAAAIFGGGVRNLEARSSLSAAVPLKPGTRLSALREVSGAEASSGELRMRRDPAERFVIVSSRELDPSIAKALGNPLITMAVLRKIDPGSKPIEGEPQFETIVFPVTTQNPLDSNGWGGICILSHHHDPPVPPLLALIETVS